MGWIWVLSILTILCGSVWFDVFLLLVSISSAWGFFWCAKLSSNLVLFSFHETLRKRRWRVRRNVKVYIEVESNVSSVRRWFCISCAHPAERCMIRKSSFLSLLITALFRFTLSLRSSPSFSRHHSEAKSYYIPPHVHARLTDLIWFWTAGIVGHWHFHIVFEATWETIGIPSLCVVSQVLWTICIWKGYWTDQRFESKLVFFYHVISFAWKCWNLKTGQTLPSLANDCIFL